MSTVYDYLPAVLYAIDQIGQGKTKTRACDDSNITIAIFERYVNASAELVDMYNEAIQRGSDAMADALVDIDTHKVYGTSDPKLAKVLSDNIKWLLSKRDSKRFGDKLEVTHNVTLDNAIINELTAARSRVPLLEAPTIEAEFEEVIEDEDAALMREMGLEP